MKITLDGIIENVISSGVWLAIAKTYYEICKNKEGVFYYKTVLKKIFTAIITSTPFILIFALAARFGLIKPSPKTIIILLLLIAIPIIKIIAKRIEEDKKLVQN